MEERETILDARQIGETLVRLAKEVEDRRGKADKLVLIGIHRRGADLAERLKKLLDKRLGKDLPLGKLDINLY
ncbi:MAG: bifunctional pyr operon transcriptional regulator/uracil phosphoribosyltransferase, partial [Desulfovibrionaceae bacterium]|nr:bifunctional pyr operon transcriptional regulator/uracil phosphoribosyltransferase [Desulfovibrionaceae bacterium]